MCIQCRTMLVLKDIITCWHTAYRRIVPNRVLYSVKNYISCHQNLQNQLMVINIIPFSIQSNTNPNTVLHPNANRDIATLSLQSQLSYLVGLQMHAPLAKCNVQLLKTTRFEERPTAQPVSDIDRKLWRTNTPGYYIMTRFQGTQWKSYQVRFIDMYSLTYHRHAPRPFGTVYQYAVHVFLTNRHQIRLGLRQET